MKVESVNRNRLPFIFIFVGMVLLLVGCFFDKPVRISHSEFGLMETFVNITVYSEDEKSGHVAVRRVLDVMQKLEKDLSRHLDDSPVSKINQQAGVEKVEVPENVFDLIKLGKKMGEETKGSFDITVTPLLELWGFGTATPRVPTEKELEEVLNLVDYRQIQLAEEENSVFLSKKGMALDLGGIAKGYIVDRGIGELVSFGVQSAFLDVGGDIRVVGTKPDGSAWRIGIQHPRNRNEIIAVLSLTDRAVVTSGDYERFFEMNDTKYHHLLDPATGYPAKKGLVSVTVIAPDAVTADIFATAFFIMGKEESLKIAESRPEIDVVLVTEELEVYFSTGIEDRIELIYREGS